MSKNVIIYRNELLPYSQTFIPAQVEKFSSYQGFYAGIESCRGATYPVPAARTILLSDFGKVTQRRKTLFLLTSFGYDAWFNRLRELSPCLIHAHFGIDGVWALLIKHKLKIPLLVTFHGYDITVNENKVNDLSNIYGPKPLPQIYLRRRKKLFREASCCLAVSEFIRSKLLEKGCPPEKTIVHYLGVDIELFSPHSNISRQPIVLFVGRLVDKKGCKYLIRAMAAVQQIIPDLELIVIGEGELRPELEKQAATSLNKYRFLGVQTSEEVKKWMNRSLMLCVPSITDLSGNSEGLPITVLEAQAMNLPVIGSIHAGIPEAIIHGETGFLTEEKDWQTIAQNILTLAREEQLRKKLAIAARKQVEQKFDLKKNTAKLEAIYDRCLLS